MCKLLNSTKRHSCDQPSELRSPYIPVNSWIMFQMMFLMFDFHHENFHKFSFHQQKSQIRLWWICKCFLLTIWASELSQIFLDNINHTENRFFRYLVGVRNIFFSSLTLKWVKVVKTEWHFSSSLITIQRAIDSNRKDSQWKWENRNEITSSHSTKVLIESKSTLKQMTKINFQYFPTLDLFFIRFESWNWSLFEIWSTSWALSESTWRNCSRVSRISLFRFVTSQHCNGGVMARCDVSDGERWLILVMERTCETFPV